MKLGQLHLPISFRHTRADDVIFVVELFSEQISLLKTLETCSEGKSQKHLEACSGPIKFMKQQHYWSKRLQHTIHTYGDVINSAGPMN